MKAFRHWEEGKQWLRIISNTDEWDEPISGWTEIWHFADGRMTYIHNDGREIEAQAI